MCESEQAKHHAHGLRVCSSSVCCQYLGQTHPSQCIHRLAPYQSVLCCCTQERCSDAAASTGTLKAALSARQAALDEQRARVAAAAAELLAWQSRCMALERQVLLAGHNHAVLANSASQGVHPPGSPSAAVPTQIRSYEGAAKGVPAPTHAASMSHTTAGLGMGLSGGRAVSVFGTSSPSMLSPQQAGAGAGAVAALAAGASAYLGRGVSQLSSPLTAASVTAGSAGRVTESRVTHSPTRYTPASAARPASPVHARTSSASGTSACSAASVSAASRPGAGGAAVASTSSAASLAGSLASYAYPYGQSALHRPSIGVSLGMNSTGLYGSPHAASGGYVSHARISSPSASLGRAGGGGLLGLAAGGQTGIAASGLSGALNTAGVTSWSLVPPYSPPRLTSASAGSLPGSYASSPSAGVGHSQQHTSLLSIMAHLKN